MSFNKRLVFLLWSLALVPLIVTITTEQSKANLVWYIRIVDFVDLIFLAPFYLIILIAIHQIVFEKKNTALSLFSLGLISIFMYGHAMHLTGNAINTYSTEIRDYKPIIPPDTYELIYFFDEILGHLLIFGAIFFLLGIWSLECTLQDDNIIQTFGSGLVFGLSYSVALIESGQPWLSFIAILLLVGSNYWKSLKEKRSLYNLWATNPITRFSITAMVSLVIGQIIYLIVFGSFIQPSHLGT